MRRLLLALALLLAGAAPAGAAERILDFVAEIGLAADGALTVTETITVQAVGDAIRHGIYRDIPTTRPDALGIRRRVDFAVLAVTRNGAPATHRVKRIADGERIHISDPRVVLPPGVYRFTITYRIQPRLRVLEDADELYWNVTGNFWTFPIDQASARVTLPPGAGILRVDAYTGPAGARGRAVRARFQPDTVAEFQTTAPLGAAEGLTIAVAFPKGIVASPEKAEGGRGILQENAPVLIALAGVVVVAVYFLVVWRRVGRDPRPNPIIPRFEPPDGLPPATLGYLYRRRYDMALFAATLTNLAVRRQLHISVAKGRYRLSRSGTAAPDAGLAPLDAAVTARLFAGGPELDLSQGRVKAVKEANALLRRGLRKQAQPAWIRNNTWWLVGGIAILAVAVATAEVILFLRGTEAIGASVVLAAIVATLPKALRAVVRGLRQRRSGLASWIVLAVTCLGPAIPLIFAVPVARALAEEGPESLAVGVLAAAGALLCVVASTALQATTPEGARLRDEAAGLRMFLTIGERERLEALYPPNITPTVFERFLPYAIALDCQNEWAAIFAATVEAAGYQSDGWSSSDSDSSSPSTVADFAGPSLASAAADAAGSDSSGSDGGGSSGGGDGGGGGGGE